MERIFYLCDGQKEDCPRKFCYKNDGICKHTTDINHAMNFKRKENRPFGNFYEAESADTAPDSMSRGGLVKEE